MKPGAEPLKSYVRTTWKSKNTMRRHPSEVAESLRVAVIKNLVLWPGLVEILCSGIVILHRTGTAINALVKITAGNVNAVPTNRWYRTGTAVNALIKITTGTINAVPINRQYRRVYSCKTLQLTKTIWTTNAWLQVGELELISELIGNSEYCISDLRGWWCLQNCWTWSIP